MMRLSKRWQQVVMWVAISIAYISMLRLVSADHSSGLSTRLLAFALIHCTLVSRASIRIIVGLLVEA